MKFKFISILGSFFSFLIFQNLANATLPNQSGVLTISCPPTNNQVNTPIPSSNTNFDPGSFVIYSSCKPVGNGGLTNPLFYYYDSLDVAFAPSSAYSDVLNFKSNSAKPKAKICNIKANFGKPYVISNAYNSTGSTAGTYNSSIYLCRELLGMKLPIGTPPNIGTKIQSNLIRSTIWLAGQHAADAINWSQESYGSFQLKVYDLNGVLLP
jgi:hypothetical protein